MKKYALLSLVLFTAPIALTACSEKEFVKGLNNTWSTGAGNAAGEPVFSAEAGQNDPAKKKNPQAGAAQPK